MNISNAAMNNNQKKNNYAFFHKRLRNRNYNIIYNEKHKNNPKK